MNVLSLIVNSKQHLGFLEEMVLIATAICNDNDARSIGEEIISSGMKTEINVVAIHTVLKRMETKGLVISKRGHPRPIRGGRSMVLYSITESGREHLKSVVTKRQSMLVKAGLSL